jgi:DNA-directed RNA polymerase specialized sigma24 family protein
VRDASSKAATLVFDHGDRGPVTDWRRSTLVYDASGQAPPLAVAGPAAHTFLYDAAGRGTGDVAGAGAGTGTFTWDAPGAWTARAQPAGGCTTLAYDVQGLPAGFDRAGTVSVTYDAGDAKRSLQCPAAWAGSTIYDPARPLWLSLRAAAPHSRKAGDWLLTDEWFLRVTADEAGALLRRHDAPREWQDDLVQGAARSLLEEFAAGRLGLDLTSLAEFEESVHGAARRHCRRVLRKLEQRFFAPWPAGFDPARRDERGGAVLDFAAGLAALPSEQREALLLRASSYEYEEIAQMLHVSVRQVRRYVTKGRKTLLGFLGLTPL